MSRVTAVFVHQPLRVPWLNDIEQTFIESEKENEFHLPLLVLGIRPNEKKKYQSYSPKG